MVQIDPLSRTPIYEQIVNQLERLILCGILPPGSQLPSVRSLSVELSVNPNTIQKSYAELDRRGITISYPGRGSFVSDQLPVLVKLRQEELGRSLRSLLKECKDHRFDRQQILDFVDEVYPVISPERSSS